MPLSTAQILEMAPDPSSRKAGQDLARPAKWSVLACDGNVSWGEIKGSGASPYRTAVDLSTAVPAYKCSCPSRKFPCKHGLGLMLVAATDPAALRSSSFPDWVVTWMSGRAGRASALAHPKPVDEKAQAKRRDQRNTKVDSGMQELGTWMGDLARQGLASLRSEPIAFWERMGARLVDAQAPGMARRIRSLGSMVVGNQPGALEEIGRVTMLLRAWTVRETLPPGLRAELFSSIGFNVTQDDLASVEPVQDTWTVLGHVHGEDDDGLRSRTVWMSGRDTGRIASLVDYAAGSRPWPAAPAPGDAFRGDLAFHPSAFPLRAVIRSGTHPSSHTHPCHHDIASMLDVVAAAVALVPWIEAVPVSVREVRLGMLGKDIALADASGGAVRMAGGNAAEALRALARNGPVDLFGLWSSGMLHPVSASVGGKLYSVSASDQGPMAVTRTA